MAFILAMVVTDVMMKITRIDGKIMISGGYDERREK